ncbi:VOC family protein [Ruminococcaceae bacterium OttesenSCG-928-D13]|nr:VOC family protein [Ruminococcaceae bacterium OttesenSCG-928-D13]
MVIGLQHIGIPTEHFDETLQFFRHVGFEETYRAVNGESRVCFLRLGSAVLEVYEGAAAGQKGAIEHFALEVTDVEAVFDRITGMGYPAVEGEICSLPFFEKGVRYFTIEGPNNEKVEFSQRL